MVVFPEGTRSVTGDMAEFLPSLGYLAMRAEVGVLPAHIGGTFEALPKGAAVPRTRELTVAFGPFLSREWLTCADRRAAAAGGLAAGGGVHPAGGGEPARRRGDARWTPTRSARPGTAGRWGRSRCAPRAAPARAEVGAVMPMKKDKDAARPLALVDRGTGFLGAHLVRVLGQSRTGRRLRVLSQRAAGVAEGSRALDVEVVTGSVTSPDDVARAVAGVDQIYHLAGMVSHKATDAHRMYAVHVDGTRLVCEAAARAGVTRIVMASTSGTVAVLAPRRRHRRRGDADARRHHLALGLLREQALSGGDGAARVRRQGGAGDGEPEPAARAGRRSSELDAPDLAVPGAARSC